MKENGDMGNVYAHMHNTNAECACLKDDFSNLVVRVPL